VDLAAAVEKLSPASRYRRFFSVLNGLDARTIAYFTDVAPPTSKPRSPASILASVTIMKGSTPPPR